MSEWENTLPEEELENYVGMIYIIKCKLNGRCYIGQKLYWKKIRRKPLKGMKRIRKDMIQSDWKTYWSSSEELKRMVKNAGEEHFERKILKHCKSKAEMNYEETRLQFEHQVLLSDKWINRMINCRISSNQIPKHMKKVN